MRAIDAVTLSSWWIRKPIVAIVAAGEGIVQVAVGGPVGQESGDHGGSTRIEMSPEQQQAAKD